MSLSILPRFLFPVILVVAVSPCFGATAKKAEDHAKSIQAILQPGQIATSTDGYSMKAKLNGKEWVATAMMSPSATGRILGYKGEESLSLPFHKSHLVAGKTIKFSEDRAVDLMTDDDVGIWSGRTGEMTYTKIDGQLAEGTFFFTATARNTSKTIVVTQGVFRVLLENE